MINWFKKILFNKYLNWRLKRWKEPGNAIDFQRSFTNLKHLLIILPEYWDLEAIQDSFIKPLYEIFGGDVKISTFEKKNFRKEDSTWIGLPKKQYLELFQSEQLDVIIDLSEPQDKFSTYMCAMLKAPLKISLESGPFDRIYNLSIRAKSAESPERRIEIALKYFKELTKASHIH
ncbi:DUF6913 domain-containing protein [Caldithrix abyssi]